MLRKICVGIKCVASNAKKLVFFAARGERWKETYLWIIVQHTPSLGTRPESLKNDDGLRDDFLREMDEDSGCLEETGGFEADGVFERFGDAVELGGCGFEVGGGGEGVQEVGEGGDGGHF